MPADFLSPLLPTSDPKPSRLLIEVDLRPVQGVRFQPTGFPDLGASFFEGPTGRQHLLVESAQSMANRLEATCWDAAQCELAEPVRGASYVRVVRPDESYLTSSIVEAHRLNSPYILEAKDKSFFQKLKDETAPFSEGAIDRRKLAAVIFRYDAFALLHGLFLAKSDLAGGRLRIERALSAFIEADGVRVAASGGVKNDPVDVRGDTAKGFGNVPFQRDEYTAERIVSFFSLDLAQIRGYGLAAECERMLVTVGLFKIQALLDGGLRLRTACDLEPAGTPRIKRPEGYSLPPLAAIREELPKAIAACSKHFAQTGGVTQVTYEK